MLLDLHAHTSAISHCCKIPAPEVIRQAKEIELDGIVLTNHYTKNYVKDNDALSFAKKYINEYEYAAQCARDADFKLFFGIEVTMEQYPSVHMLVFGVAPGFCLAYPDMYDYDQETLYRIVHEHGGTLVQAHPFRNGTHVLDIRYLDGIEINCHPYYNLSYSAELTKIAKETSLILTCGGDYHADTYHAHCGTYIPDTVANGIDLGIYLRTTDQIKLRIHEPNTETYYETNYTRRNIPNKG